jgi:1-deoxyxylulose-5-phosphate synthase
VYSPVGPGQNDRGLSRKHILSGIDASLRRLNVDYVDLYQIHRYDGHTPVEETMSALHDVVRAGKARYIGASSMYAWQFAKAQHAADAHGWTRFVSMQNHYNLVYREEEREVIPLCIDQGVGVIPWSPLARGLLAGTRTRDGERRTVRSGSDPFGDSLYKMPSDFDVVERCMQVAAERGVPSAQVALAWLLHKPGVTAPIVGATKGGHLEDALAAEDLSLRDLCFCPPPATVTRSGVAVVVVAMSCSAGRMSDPVPVLISGRHKRDVISGLAGGGARLL